jgi:beta-glucosidase-like glycosyl hydrolase
MTHFIYTLSGTKITEQERVFLSKAQPFGICLFTHNIESFDQVKALCHDLKSICPKIEILSDEEGGRVSRFISAGLISKDEFPAAGSYNQVARDKGLDFAKNLLRNNCYNVGLRIKSLGLTRVFAPSADMYFKDADQIIGDRSFGFDYATDEKNPDLEGQVLRIVEFCKAAIQGWTDAGIGVVLKHLLGHGRSVTDTHLELSRIKTPLDVLEQTDFAVFRHLAKDLEGIAPDVWAMTAHIIFECLDTNHPVTTSTQAVSYIRNTIAFKGGLTSDALEMKALGSDIVASALAAKAAGVGVLLYCGGDISVMQNLENKLNGISFLDNQIVSS